MDKEAGFLLKASVGIVGLGLMGGSMAMGLQGKCARIVGIDSDPGVLRQALDSAVIQAGYRSMDELPADLDLIILAVPVRSILDLIERLPALYRGSAMLLDLGSTKTEIMAAMGRLPARFDPLGGHPMCGKEDSGFLHADAGLYRSATFALTALERTSPRTRRLARELAEALGAKPVWIDAATHDRYTAATSHVPYLIANALAATTPAETQRLVGPGFRSTTRLAGSSIEMMLDILDTNRSNILQELDVFQDQLARISQLLAAGDEQALAKLLSEGKAKHALLAS